MTLLPRFMVRCLIVWPVLMTLVFLPVPSWLLALVACAGTGMTLYAAIEGVRWARSEES